MTATKGNTRYAQRAFSLPPGATEIVLVRHGASAHVAPGELFPLTDDGWGDPALAPEGERQVEAVTLRLASEAITGLFVSGLRRTLQTAAPLAARLGLEPVVVRDLREVYIGDYEAGVFRIKQNEGDALVARVFAEERWDVIPNAEPIEVFAGRVRSGIETIVAAVGPDAGAVAIVHAGVVAELCRQATGSRPFAFINSDNASITRLVVLNDGRWVLRSFNDTAHLAQLVAEAATSAAATGRVGLTTTA